MSEYQYYEFQKVDGRLSEKEMQQLRRFSTRADITPTSFVNEYHFGDFKGNEDAWMEKYFEGFLYLANWGTREVQLAMPAGLLPVKTAKQYCSSHAASCREKNGKLILKFLSDEESGGAWLEGGGNLSPLLEIRNELAHGDFRSLYLGWLLGVQAGEVKESEQELAVPPNLGELSGPQAGLADFLRLDPDLLAVAARNSPRAKADSASREELSAWIASLTVREKDEILVQLVEGNAAKIGPKIQSRFSRQRGTSEPTAGLKPRTVAELLSAAESYGEKREREEQKKIAAKQVRLTQKAAMAREKHLSSLKGSSETIWATVETLVATRQPKSYDEAVQHLADLRDLAEREGRHTEFTQRLGMLRNQQAAKKSLIDRLARGGL